MGWLFWCKLLLLLVWFILIIVWCFRVTCRLLPENTFLKFNFIFINIFVHFKNDKKKPSIVPWISFVCIVRRKSQTENMIQNDIIHVYLTNKMNVREARDKSIVLKLVQFFLCCWSFAVVYVQLILIPWNSHNQT